jgi:hypothetical protein
MISNADMDLPIRLSSVSSLNQAPGDCHTHYPPPETWEGQGGGEEHVMWSDLARRFPSTRLYRFSMWPLVLALAPLVFPLVYIPVEAGGQRYEEMRVDGGTATQVFFYGFSLDLNAAVHELGIQARLPVRLFIVRNGKLTVPWQLVRPSILPIADRSLNGLIGSQVVGDLYRIYTIAQRDGIEFNLTYIPDDYDIGAQESFDKEAMNRLFQLGYEWARAGYPWQKLPPGLEEHAPGTR